MKSPSGWPCNAMTKDVLLTICGLQDMELAVSEEEVGEEPIEVITPGTYYLKDGKHYVRYEEMVEGSSGTIQNTIRFTEDGKLEVLRSGLTRAHMIFEKGKMNVSPYTTPYGEITVGVFTTDMQVDVTDLKISVHVAYTLDMNGEKVADCNIDLTIQAKEQKKIPS